MKGLKAKSVLKTDCRLITYLTCTLKHVGCDFTVYKVSLAE